MGIRLALLHHHQSSDCSQPDQARTCHRRSSPHQSITWRKKKKARSEPSEEKPEWNKPINPLEFFFFLGLFDLQLQVSPKERTTNLSIQSISLLTFPATRNFTTGLRVHLQHFSGLRSWALPFSESISLISSHAGPSSLGHRCYTGALPAHYNSLLAIRPPPLSSWSPQLDTS